MSNKPNVLVTSLIDVDAWNAAGWEGAVFMHDPSGRSSPGMGILFRNERAARTIFEGLRQRLGEIDEHDELRVAIIEGDVLGEEPGYTIHFNTDLDGLESRVRASGTVPKIDRVVTIGRVHRMNPAPGSPHLGNFKREYAKHGRYWLVPVVGGAANPRPLMDLRIGKTKVLLRDIAEITSADDIDRVVMERGRNSRGGRA